MDYDVFISCKSGDYEIAEEVYLYLKDNGFHVFLSSKELRRMKESEYMDAISEALDSAYHLIVLSSSVANIKSKWVKFEWTTFLNELLSERKHGQIMSLVKDISAVELPIQLRHYEMFNLDDYKERILPYIETPNYLQRKAEAKEMERQEEERRKTEEAKKQEIERKKKELTELAEDYHQKMSALQSIEGRKILHILKELGVTDRKCPVCNEIVPVSKPFCARCGWKFSPTHGIPELNYLVEPENDQLFFSKELFAERADLQSQLQHLNESMIDAKHREKEFVDLNRKCLKNIEEIEEKNKGLELENRKYKDSILNLETELRKNKNETNILKSQIQSLSVSFREVRCEKEKLAILNENNQKAIYKAKNKNKELELEKTKFKEMISKLESNLKADENTIQELRKELQSVIEERSILQTQIAKATIGEKNGTPTLSNDIEKKYRVTLVDTGAAKLQMVKLIKEILGWGLKEAKDFVDATPSIFPDLFSEYEMQRISHLIEECGGTLQKTCIQENTPIVSTQKTTIIDRNAPCPCGSGKKYKNCHGRNM